MRRLRAGWRAQRPVIRLAALFAAGAVSALAHAPFFLQPLFMAGLVLLVLSLDDARRCARPMRAGFARGWAFAAGLFLGGIWWVANAFLVDGDTYIWLIWAPLTLLPAGLALFWGAAGAAYARLAPRGPGRVAIFAGIVLAAEMARATVLSGFPWNLPGHIFEAGGAMSQLAALIGASGLSALTLYAFAAPAALAGPGRPMARATPMLTGLLLLSAGWGWGAARLAGAETEETGSRLRIVQLALPQSALRPDNRDAVLDAYLELSTQSSLDGIDAVIWPEGSVPAWLMNEPELLARIAERLPSGTRLIAGAPHVEFGDPGQPDRYYNSMHVLRIVDGRVDVEARYDKARLVPFGEANTLAALTRPLGLETLSQYGVGFDAGPGARALNLEGLPMFAPLICYETVYPGYLDARGARPGFLLNISNDSWFGDSAGPAQLLNQARYRSIEAGLPLVRAASAGISGQIDGYGRAALLSTVEQSQAFDLVLLKGLDESIYLKYGITAWGVAFLLLIALTAWKSLLQPLKKAAKRRKHVD
jgi:apolipoprotein N-acyltransferase